jgi:hypothetical protein
MKRSLSTAFVIVVAIGCASPPPPAATATSTPEPRPAVAPPATSEAVARADALVEDLRRRQVAQEKADRESRLSPPPETPMRRVTTSPAPPPSPATLSQPAIAPWPDRPAQTANGKDEAWWKFEMRFAEGRLADSEDRLEEAKEARDAAERTMLTHGIGSAAYSTAMDLFNRASAMVTHYDAEVKSHRAAVEKIREDARRAGVPPGWLRWR